MRKLKAAIIISSVITLFSCEKNEVKGDLAIEHTKTSAKLDDARVSEEQAKIAATNFINRMGKNNFLKGSTRSGVSYKTIDRISQIESGDKSAKLYVTNYKNGGFTLLSDNKNYAPVLAYSETGKFDINDPNLNSGIKIWLEQILEDVSFKKNDDDATVFSNRLAWDELMTTENAQVANNFSGDFAQRNEAFNRRMGEIMAENGGAEAGVTVLPLSAASSYLPPERVSHFKSIAQQYGSPEQFTIVTIINKDISQEIGPLMNTNWYQSGKFAQEVPNDYAGCTAVAAGQIMNYYRYPSSFNWNNMTNANLNSYNDISFFMKTLGTEFKMKYDSDGSGATNGNVKSALQRYGYTVQEVDHSAEGVETELKNRRPVYLTGCRTNAFLGLIYKDCHAWVAEGLQKYDKLSGYRIEWQKSNYQYGTDGITYNQVGSSTSFYYVNWGWGQSYNGWFKFNMHKNEQVGYDYKHSQKNLYIYKGS